MSSLHPFKVFLHENKLFDVLDGFKLAKREDRCVENESMPETKEVEIQQVENVTGNQCLTCKCTLSERDDQTSHYKTDWHRYNIKLRLLEQPPVSEEEFGDAADTFSISGSDTDDDNLIINPRDEHHRLSISLLKSSEDAEVSHDEQFDNRMPKLYFQNSNKDIVSVYKKVLYSRQNSDVDSDITALTLQTLKSAQNQFWLVVLFNAGHFAAAVFEGSKVVVHKTFHRYIVRAKRGTVQSINDNSSGGSMAKSAGASLRRHNEAALDENIRSLLKSWKDDYVDKCSLIFLRVPHYKKSLFYGGKEPLLVQKDTRIRTIPFVTRRPTFNEVQRVHQELFSVTIHGKQSITDVLSPCRPKSKEDLPTKTEESSFKPAPTQLDAHDSDDGIELTFTQESISTADLEIFEQSSNTKKKKKKRTNKKTKEKVESDSESTTRTKSFSDQTSPLSHLSPTDKETMDRLYTAVKLSNVDMLRDVLMSLKHLEKNSDDANKIELNSEELVDSSLPQPTDSDGNVDKITSDLLSLNLDSSGNTLLHIASKLANKEIIFMLLQFGADPSIKNFSSFLPYCMCSNKEARKTYRRFRAKYPQLYDYKKAQVPSPLTEDREEEIKKKQNEKKKAQKLAKKEKTKRVKEEEAKRLEEQSEKERFLALSDREKRLIAVERRMLNQPNVKISGDRRCYTCAENLFAKVPFEYLEFQFCSMTCLKTHKSKAIS